MKRSHFLLALCIPLIYIKSYSQECIVIPEAIKGKYEGGCERGKANGQGIAKGADIFEGEFKNGLPDGIGKYKWNNQNYYIGNWKKGLRDGKGVMHYTNTFKDSTVEGYWKKDKYLGFYEKAYEVKAMTGRVTRVNCRISDKEGDDISVIVNKIGEGIVTISNITILRGTYYTQNIQRLTNMSVTTIKGVSFPFSAIFNFSNGETAEVIFNEKADYDVTVEVI